MIVPEPAIQRLSARRSHCRGASREHARRPAAEADWSLRKRHCQRFWQSDAAARRLCLVEGSDGLYRFLRRSIRKHCPFLSTALGEKITVTERRPAYRSKARDYLTFFSLGTGRCGHNFDFIFITSIASHSCFQSRFPNPLVLHPMFLKTTEGIT